jgi:NADPH2:quinone reductase
MRAVVVNSFGDPSMLVPATLPAPTLQPGEMLIRVAAAAVTNTDTYLRAGNRSSFYGELPALPYVPGLYGAGVVEAMGPPIPGTSSKTTSNETNFSVGDRVYFGKSRSGTYAELCACDAAHVFKLPQQISFEKGAFLARHTVVAYNAMQAVNIRSGDLVFIGGAATGCGLMLVQMARALGAHVVGSAGSQEGIQMVMAAGADLCVSYHDNKGSGADRGFVGALQRAYPQGFDVCVDFWVHGHSESDVTLIARHGGRILLVHSGLHNSGWQISAKNIVSKELEVRGLSESAWSCSDLRRQAPFVQSCLLRGLIDPPLGPSFPLVQAAEAHNEVIGKSHRADVSNVVLIP